ncbi:type II secretion system protein GspD [Jonquetella anthropi]|uniref:type II secretion system protein GspD n=1 Tax=Jonquetella anthropi TaxID=428712 RepID=UPI0023EF58EB|nr:secretin N-terminal domain-containing protein [Jonquetella anthropi]
MRRVVSALFALLCLTSASFAACLRGVRIEQGGDRLVEAWFTGQDLPRPAVVSQGPDGVKLRFPSCALKLTGDILTPPLLWGVSAELKDGGADVFIRTRVPMVLKKLESDPGGIKAYVKLESAGKKGAPSAGCAAKPAGQKEKRLTMSLTEVKVADALRLAAEGLKCSIIVDEPETSPTVTLSLRDVTAQEALELITASAGYGWAKIGSTILVGPRSVLAARLGKNGLKSYDVFWADPGKTGALVKSIVGLVGDDAVSVDERRNRIYVKGTPAQQEQVRELLAQLDEPADQVMIKARIIEVNDDATSEMESVLQAVYHQWWLSFSSGVASLGFFDSSSPLAPSSGTAQGAGTVARMLDARIAGLVEKGKARVLADPTVVVLDGHKATIKLVDRVKYVSWRDDAGNPGYSDEEVGPRLEVTPRVGSEGGMTISMALKTGEIVQWKRGGLGEDVPQISEREVSSSVRVLDGQPFVVGGLFKESVSKTTQRIPVLGDLPLLGSLFRSSRRRSVRSQVVMVVIPTLLPAR